MCILLNVLCIAYLLAVPSQGFDYCQLTCEGHKHSICKSDCKTKQGIKRVPPDFKFRKQCLDFHNSFRRDIALDIYKGHGCHIANNMMALKYDLELEYVAMCWIYSSGSANLDKCPTTQMFKNHVGQNIYMGTDNLTDESQLDSVFRSWLVEDGNMMNIRCPYEWFYDGKNQTTFPQMIWARTTHIGCAYCTIRDNNSRTQYLMACNYGPGGNRIGEKVYDVGYPATDCPADVTSKRWSGLCGEYEPWTRDAQMTGNPFYEAQEKTRQDLKSRSRLINAFGHCRLIIIWLTLVKFL